MTTRQPGRRSQRSVDLDRAAAHDYSRLPEPLDPARLVVTHDVDPETHEVPSKFATPDIADMARTGAIGAAF